MASSKAKGKRPLRPQSAGGDNPAKKKKGSPGEEPKPAKRQAARCAKPKDFEQVGDKGSNWVNVYEKEAQLAAYISFKTTSELRQFAISWVCLSAERYFSAAAKGLAKKQPFRFLNTISGKRQIEAVKDSPVTAWPYTAENTTDIQNNQRKKIVAWCLVKMAADIETYNQATVEANNLKTHQEQTSFLERHKDVARKDGTKLELKFPKKPVGFPKPSMGPFTDLGENQLEVYNRCWEVLRYLGTGFHRKNWANRFQSVTVINKGRLVNDTHSPSWMREKAPVPKVSSNLGNFGQVFESDRLPPIKVTINWIPIIKKDGTDQLRLEMERALAEQITIPSRIQILPWDPRVCSRDAQFRDEIRRLFNCKELGIDIQTMRLEYYDGKWRMKIDMNALEGHWRHLRDIMSDPGNSDFTFTVTMESFDRDDPTIDIFEDPHNALNLGNLPALLSVDKSPDGHEGAGVEPPSNALVLEKSVQFAEARADGIPSSAKPRTFETTQEQIDFYDGFDIQDLATDSLQGRIAWQERLIDTITAFPKAKENKTQSLKNVGVSENEKNALQRAVQDAHHASEALIQPKVDDDYYTLHSAFSGSNTRAGPCLDLCLDLLVCEKRADKYHSFLLEGETACDFYDYQITGAVGAILKLFGSIDTTRLLEATAFNPMDRRAEKALSAGEKLQDLRIHGAMIADGTGFGKTKQCLLAAMLFALLTVENKPMLLLVPASLIYQWVAEIRDQWPGLKPVLSYSRLHITDCQELSREQMLNLQFPMDLEYLLDNQNVAAKRAVIITSYETHKSRTTWRVPDAVENRPKHAAKQRKTKNPLNKMIGLRTRHDWKFGLLIADEAHEMKNKRSVLWGILQMQKYPAVLFATATPMFNAIRDLLGLVDLLGLNAMKDLSDQTKGTPDAITLKKLQKLNLSQLKAEYQQLDPKSPLRLMILDVKLLRRVMRTKREERHAAVAQFFALVLDTIAIQRSQGSSLPMSDGSAVPIRDKFKQIITKTILAPFNNLEKCEYQVQHKIYALKYVQETANHKPEMDTVEVPGEQSTYSLAGVKPLRALEVLACSTKLARLDIRYNATGGNTHIAQLAEWRDQGLTAEWIHRVVRQPGELTWPISSATELIAFLATGSPRLRAIFQVILNYNILYPVDSARYGHHQKAMIVESSLLSAWYLEVVLNTALICTRVMHSGLNEEQRTNLVRDFNNPTSGLKVLIITYSIGSVGLNLHEACNVVILSTPGRSWSHEAQAFGRCLRINSLFDLKVLRIEVPQSHDQYRNARQAEKASLQLAINARDPPIESLLLKLLRQLQVEVDEFRKSDRARDLMKEKAAMDREYEKELDRFLRLKELQKKSKTRSKVVAKPSAGEAESTEEEVELAEEDDGSGEEDDGFGEEDDGSGEEEEEDESDEEEKDLYSSLLNPSQATTKATDADIEKFKEKMRWKYFTQVKQPNDETRYQLALFNIPAGKKWTTDDLHDPDHPIYFEIGLRLLYNKLRDFKGLHLGTSIHVHYSSISQQHQDRLEKIIKDLADEETSARKVEPRKEDFDHLAEDSDGN